MSSINLKTPDLTELKPRIMVFGVGGAGCNAVNNMIEAGLQGCDFVVANTDAQSLNLSKADRIVQMGIAVTEGLGAGSQPDVGRAAAEEVIDEIADHLSGAHMVFITAGMGGGTGTGSAPVVARAARDQGILTVGVVTKPFFFEGQRRLRVAEAGIEELSQHVDTLIVIPNQNLFRIANDRTTFADAFAMADQVLYSGVACITDLMVKEGLINLDFADVRSVMRNMGKAMMGTGEASGEGRAMQAAEAAISNPLLDEVSMKGARGLLVSVTGGRDLTLFEVDEATTRIREEVDDDANIIFGATFDDSLDGVMRVSVVATGIEPAPELEEEPREENRVVAFSDRSQRRVASGGAPAAKAAIPEMAVAAVAADLEDFDPERDGAEPAPEDEGFDALGAPEDLDEAFEGEEDYADDPRMRRREPVYEDEYDDYEDDPRGARRPAAEARDRRLAAEEERRPMSLLRRITNGIGRRDDEEDDYEEEDVRPTAAELRRQNRREAARRERPTSVTEREEAEYRRRERAPDSYRRARHQDQEPVSRTRPASRSAAAEDDQLEIPAFLRRQAN